MPKQSLKKALTMHKTVLFKWHATKNAARRCRQRLGVFDFVDSSSKNKNLSKIINYLKVS
jgi:hypothetical protein